MLFSLLDPRLWLAVAVVVAVSAGGGYFKGRHDGRLLERADTAAAVAQANREARKNEQLRQDRVDKAARAAAARERGLVADAARARSLSLGLRDDLDSLRRDSAQSLSAAQQALAATSELLATCSQRYTELAAEADRADLEARELRQAWPK